MKDLVPSHHYAHIDIGSLGFPGDRAITAGRRDYLAWPSPTIFENEATNFSVNRKSVGDSRNKYGGAHGTRPGHVLVVLDRRSDKLNEEKPETDTTLIKLIP